MWSSIANSYFKVWAKSLRFCNGYSESFCLCEDCLILVKGEEVLQSEVFRRR